MKKITLFTALIIFLCCISAVNAADDNTDTLEITQNQDTLSIDDAQETLSAEDNRLPSDIEITASSITYGEDLNITVKLPGDVSRRANVSVADESKLVSLKNGTGTSVFSDLNAGKYTIFASYAGDANYLPSNASKTISVKKADAGITITADPIDYGETLSVTLTAPKDITKRINVTIENQSKLVSVKNGKATLKFNNLAPAKYTITATYAGDANYKKSQSQKSVTVNKAPAAIKLTANAVAYGEDLTVTVKLPKDVPKRALVTIGNESKYVSLKNGEGTVKFSDLKVGKYIITASYAGDANYLKSEVNRTATVKKADAGISIKADSIDYGETLSITVSAPKDITKRINLTFENQPKLVSVKNGQVTVKFKDLTPGKYMITATYAGDANYKKSQANKTATVKKADPAIKITAKSVRCGEDLTVTVKLAKDVTKRALITVENQSKYVSLKNGEGTVKFSDLNRGKHVITASYAGDANYLPSEVNKTANVRDTFDIGLYIIHIDAEYGDWNTTDTIKHDEQAYAKIFVPADISRRINLTIENQSQLLQADKNGEISFLLNYLKSGTYNITASYAGDDNYEKSSATTQITVQKADKYMVIDYLFYHNGVDIRVLLSQQIPEINITVNNESYVRSPENGEIHIKIDNASIGTYNITASYAGDENYEKSTETILINVSKEDLEYLKVNTGFYKNGEWYAADTIDCKETIYVSIIKPEDLTAEIKFMLDGEEYAQPYSQMEWFINYRFADLEPGTHLIEVSCLGDEKYGPEEHSKEIIVIGDNDTKRQIELDSPFGLMDYYSYNNTHACVFDTGDNTGQGIDAYITYVDSLEVDGEGSYVTYGPHEVKIYIPDSEDYIGGEWTFSVNFDEIKIHSY